MKKGFIGAVSLGVVLVVFIISMIFCIEKIPVGYEGVVYSMRNGATGEILTQGWHLVAPTKKVEEFTIGNEILVLTKDKREGSKGNDSFRVSTSDDATIAISFQMSYRFIPESLVRTFNRFKGMSGEDIVENRVKPVMKSKVSEVTTDFSLMDIYSGNRAEINDKLTKYLNEEFGKSYGMEVLDASIIDVHPDKQLKKTINNRVEALQKSSKHKPNRKLQKSKLRLR